MQPLDDFLNTQHHLTEARKHSYRMSLKAWCKLAKEDFEKHYLNKHKVHDVLTQIEGKYEPSTYNTYLTNYKRYAKYLSDPDDEQYPKLWRKLKLKRIDWEEKLKNKRLTEEEFLSLIDACDHPRDRAMYCTAVSGALRPGELLGLKVGDVHIEGPEIRVTVSGKTGTRTFLMNIYAPVLKHWLNFHPYKKDLSAPLWLQKKHRSSNGLMERRFIQQFKIHCKRAGIKRNLSPHVLRHTKATWTAKNRRVRISDKQANALFGWKPNSTMYRRYTHLAGTDTDDAFRMLEDVEPQQKDATASKLKQKKCFNCSEPNSPDSLYCFKCGFVLDETEAKRQRQDRELMDFIRNALTDPEVIRALAESKKPP